MGALRGIVGFFAFIAAGIVAVAVGAFMIRGNMHMWDRNAKKDDDKSS